MTRADACAQTCATLDAYVGAWKLSRCRLSHVGWKFDTGALRRLLATRVLGYITRSVGPRRKVSPAQIVWYGQQVTAPKIVTQIATELAALHAKRRSVSALAESYLDRLRGELARRKAVAALELATEYHRRVRKLYRSKYGRIEGGSKGGEDIDRCRYSKSYHGKYGLAYSKYAGVISSRGQGRWIATLYPTQGKIIKLDLDAWIARGEIVVA